MAGLEQEFFLIPRDAFARRLDLQAHILKSAFFLMTLLQNSKKYIRALNFQNFKMTGRTVLGYTYTRTHTHTIYIYIYIYIYVYTHTHTHTHTHTL